MPIARFTTNHSSRTAWHFLLDALICVIGFWAAAAIRFHEAAPRQFGDYASTVLVAAIILPSACYVLGLYMPVHRGSRAHYRVLLLAVAVAIMTMVILMKGSVDFSSRVGRGVLVVGVAFIAAAAAGHQFVLRRLLAAGQERLAFVVGSERDEAMASTFVELAPKPLTVAGVFARDGYSPTSSFNVLGGWNDVEAKIAEQDIRRVLCTEEHLTDPALAGSLRVLRYEGLRVDTLAHAFEEAYQTVPLVLVTDAWLLHAAEHPQVVYIRKLKRAFDIVASLALMLILAPAFLMGALLVWVGGGRPIFYRQVRTGRLGRPFEIYKLRTMRTDAERDGAKWSSAKGDSRVIFGGAFLRKFRIDEIPQLWNILRGEMSFVGPRPERPEFIDELAKEIPFYKERLLLPPGLTGWAQVNYPYGSSVDDARHKLEYDLYYLKHMGLIFDLLVLLDTVRTVLGGGVSVQFPERQHVTAQLRDGMARRAAQAPA